MICDFCFSTEGHWRHLPRQVDDGWWIACDECHELIEGGNRMSLIGRGLARLRELTGNEGYSASAVAGLHDEFWRLRDPAIRPYAEVRAKVGV